RRSSRARGSSSRSRPSRPEARLATARRPPTRVAPARTAPLPSNRRRGLAPLTWLVRGLVLLLLGAALWKLASLGWQEVQYWLFTRPVLIEGRTASPAGPTPDAGLQHALDRAADGGSGE